MPATQNDSVKKWLYIFAAFVAFLIVFGGFVRLTRSGLSIVEWNPISGSMPPMGEQAWREEFAKYQLTPEYIKVNSTMTLDEYKYIFYIEWIHRNIARFAGLVYALPLFYFMFIKRSIPWREFAIYFVMGLLFISQALAGWIMVASGLVDRPSVSHFNLTLHLLLALSLLGFGLWTAFGHQYGFYKAGKWSNASKVALFYFILLIVQIAYGGFTAGLKAGHISNTWPLMFGVLIPPNLFSSLINLIESPQSIVFVHRWFAFAVLLAVPLVYSASKKQGNPQDLLVGLKWLLGIVLLQIILGVLTVLSFVNIVIALLHQANAIVLMGLSIYLLHRFRSRDSGES